MLGVWFGFNGKHEALRSQQCRVLTPNDGRWWFTVKEKQILLNTLKQDYYTITCELSCVCVHSNVSLALYYS